VDFADAKRRVGDRVALQGNVDNELLLTGPIEAIEDAVEACVSTGGHEGHILNLGHGVLKDTPFDHVCRFIETAKRVRAAGESPSIATR
jgi:uroporphyrinogen decarboxylase